MPLLEKYSRLTLHARATGVKDLSIREENNVLYITGNTTGLIASQLSSLSKELNPDNTKDLVLTISIIPGTEVEEIYEVKSGDSLSKIATKYTGVTWTQIFEANKDQIKNPDMIQPGMKLRIPKQ